MTLECWRLALGGFTGMLENILPGLDDPNAHPLVKIAQKLAAAYRKDYPETVTEGRLPEQPQSLSPLSREQLSLLWWDAAIRYRGRWSHMVNLARIWHLFDSTIPESLQRHVRKLRRDFPRVPSPDPIIALFDKP